MKMGNKWLPSRLLRRKFKPQYIGVEKGGRRSEGPVILTSPDRNYIGFTFTISTDISSTWMV